MLSYEDTVKFLSKIMDLRTTDLLVMMVDYNKPPKTALRALRRDMVFDELMDRARELDTPRKVRLLATIRSYMEVADGE